MVVRSSQNEGKGDNSPRRGSEKVLFIASVYTHLAAFHIPFMKLLQEKGYDVHAAASSAEGRREEVEALGVKCWEIPFARSPYSLANVQAFRRLKTLLKEHHFDLIHVHTPVAAFLGRYLAKATKQGPVLYTAHGFHFYQGAPLRNWLIYYTAERLAARWTDGLIVMNEEDFGSGQKMGFSPKNNLFYVHGVGVDIHIHNLKTTDKLKNIINLPKDGIVITCVAEFTPNKNHKFLLDAWQVLTQRYNNIYLLLAGKGKLEKKIKRLIEKEIIDRVYFLGYRHDIPEVLSGTDIVALVSKREGLPKCIMEAMACGKPVIATNVRGSRDLVKHNITGKLVNDNDLTELIQAFEELIQSKDLREQMGNYARKAIQGYSLEKVLDEMTNIYNRFLGGNSRF